MRPIKPRDDQNPAKWQSFVELYANYVRNRPEGTAVYVLSESQEISEYSYAELDQLSNKIANYLTAQNLPEQSLVGVCIEKSLLLYATLIAIWKCRHIYVPVSPNLNQSQREFVIHDSNVAILLASNQQHSLLNATASCPLINLEIETNTQDFSAHFLAKDNQPTDGAYIIYTSGTTGTKKGVLLSHAGIHGAITTHSSLLNVTRTDRIVQFADSSVDVSLMETWLALANGATLCALQLHVNNYVLQFFNIFERLGISVAILPPTLLHKLIENMTPAQLTENLGEKLRHLTRLISATEDVAPELLQRWQTLNAEKKRRTFNGYGPTETTVGATLIEYISGEMTIGSQENCFDGYSISLLVDATLVREGKGELLISGPGLAIGYWSSGRLDQAKTDKAFRTIGGRRYYFTGDYVNRLPHGNYQFLSRIKLDRQVEVAGTRIELSSVEAQLETHQKITAAAVAKGPNRLIAYIKTTGTISLNELRSIFTDRDDYNPPDLPAKFYVVAPDENLDDIKAGNAPALPTTQIEADQQKSDRVDLNEFEACMLRIWQDIFEMEIDLDTKFHEIGGYSLVLYRLFAVIRSEFQQDISDIPIPTELTPRYMARQLLLNKYYQRSCTSVQTTDNATATLFLLHPLAAGAVKKYRDFVDKLHFRGDVFLITPPLLSQQFDNSDHRALYDTLSVSVEEMAYSICYAMRTVQPRGRIVLAGWSYGGMLCYAVSEYIRKVFKQEPPIFLIDAQAPYILSNYSSRDFNSRLVLITEGIAKDCQRDDLIAVIRTCMQKPELNNSNYAERINFIFSEIINFLQTKSTVTPTEAQSAYADASDSLRVVDIYRTAWRNYLAVLAYKPKHQCQNCILYTAPIATQNIFEVRGQDWEIFVINYTMRVIEGATHFNVVEQTQLLVDMQSQLRRILNVTHNTTTSEYNMLLAEVGVQLQDERGQAQTARDVVSGFLSGDNARVLVVEGGTGTGRSAFYNGLKKANANPWLNGYIPLFIDLSEKSDADAKVCVAVELMNQHGLTIFELGENKLLVVFYGYTELSSRKLFDLFSTNNLHESAATKLILICKPRFPETRYSNIFSQATIKWRTLNLSALQLNQLIVKRKIPSIIKRFFDTLMADMRSRNYKLSIRVFRYYIEFLSSEAGSRLLVQNVSYTEILFAATIHAYKEWLKNEIQHWNMCYGLPTFLADPNKDSHNLLKKIAFLLFLIRSNAELFADRLQKLLLQNEQFINFLLDVAPLFGVSNSVGLIDENIAAMLTAEFLLDMLDAEFNWTRPPASLPANTKITPLALFEHDQRVRDFFILMLAKRTDAKTIIARILAAQPDCRTAAYIMTLFYGQRALPVISKMLEQQSLFRLDTKLTQAILSSNRLLGFFENNLVVANDVRAENPTPTVTKPSRYHIRGLHKVGDNRFITVDAGGNVYLYNCADLAQTKIYTHATGIISSGHSESGLWLGDNLGHLTIIDLQGNIIARIDLNHVFLHLTCMNNVAYAIDDKNILYKLQLNAGVITCEMLLELDDAVNTLYCHPDSRLIFIGCKTGRLIVVNPDTKTISYQQCLFSSAISCLLVANDSLYVAHENGLIYVLHQQTNDLRILQNISDSPVALSRNANGKIHVIDQQGAVFSLDNNPSLLHDRVAFPGALKFIGTMTGNHAFAVSVNNSLGIYTNTFGQLCESVRELRESVVYTLNSHGNCIWFATQSQLIEYDTTRNCYSNVFNVPKCSCFNLSADRTLLAVIINNSILQVFSLDNLQTPLLQLPANNLQQNLTQNNEALFFTPDNEHIICYSNEEIRIFDIKNQKLVRRVMYVNDVFCTAQNLFFAQSQTIGSIALTDLTAPAEQLLVHSEPIQRVIYLAELNTFVITNNRGALLFYDAMTKQATDAFQLNRREVKSLIQLTPDKIAALTNDGIMLCFQHHSDSPCWQLNWSSTSRLALLNSVSPEIDLKQQQHADLVTRELLLAHNEQPNDTDLIDRANKLKSGIKFYRAV